MKFAYADPPYLGCGKSHYGHLHSAAAEYDTIEAHSNLVNRLTADYPDGWALSCTSGNLHDILPLCPREARIGAWTKPFASFKPGVNPGYCWEPLIWMGGRKHGKGRPTVRDYCAVNITMKRGFPGAKPEGFCQWVFDLLGAERGDELHDLFPGSGAVGRAWDAFQSQGVFA